MAGKYAAKQNKELIAGLVTLGAAVVLLVVTALCMQMCSAPPPEGSSPSTLESLSTAPTRPPLVANPYDSGDFGYRDGYLTCISGESWLGIDVSSHQGVIDWPRVAQEGVEFAIIRLGYRGWGNGEIKEDIMGKTNLQGAKAAGLKVGVYFYSQAVTVEEAQQEAQFLLDQLQGQSLEMPVVFDWEIFSEAGRTANVDSETLNACTLAFCQMIQAAGYEPMVYFNRDVGDRLMDLQLYQQLGYPFWLALYSDMTYPYRVEMWQYTGSGRMPGIETTVDINLYFPFS